jgi:hypothetical protein
MTKARTRYHILIALLLAAGWAGAQEPETEPPAGEEGLEGLEEGTGEEAGEAAEPAPKLDFETELALKKKAGSYSVKLRDLEQKINQLKEQIFRSKARLSLLAEKVLAGPAGAGAQAQIYYNNQMGSSYRLTKAVFVLDGAPIYNKTSEKGLKGKKKKKIQIFNGALLPGEHTISVHLEYKGFGYGFFAYLNKYKFKVRSSHAFSVDAGKSKKLIVVSFEKGGITTPLDERPALKYVESVAALGE